ncbi:MAG: M23 family metallopeptidase [Proteobacteria bacterium]|nr:M23 family metallopeptidase [Desulfobacula sp.]MBU4129291.1 M23 family metallopeptidase [Pseudomonadota bacterium]
MATSLLFILTSAVPVVDMKSTSFPMMSQSVSDVSAPESMVSSQKKTILGTIKNGDTASSLLNTYLPLKTIYDLNDRSNAVFPLTGIRKGHSYKISLLEDMLVGFEYEINKEDRLVIQKEADTYSISKIPIEYKIREETISMEILTSLAEAVKKFGEEPVLAWKLADIFAWDIDFTRDIHPGDKINILVEKKYRNNAFYGYSDIKAAFFTNNGVEYKAFLYEDATGRKGYYTEEGKSLKKAFLKAPLNFSRISSNFSKRRFHPILKEYRAHKGVDYAAPKNTPIKSVADGIIVSIGYNNTMGKNITIRHFNGYETRYYHMNKYAGGMKKNIKVFQGDVIGFVGNTGLATGDHLCFRMSKQGKVVNPLKQTTVSATPVSKKEMAGFLAQTKADTTKIISSQKLARSDL